MLKFDKFAFSYDKYNFIQKRVLNRYLPFLKNRVVDLGCGSEGLCKYRDFEFYLGIDISENMLKLNPCNTKQMDFNSKETFEFLKTINFKQLVSFSALQWAYDIDFVFSQIAELNKEYILAIFTSNTFKSFHSYIGVKSPIYSREYLLNSAKILNFDSYEILNYKLDFNSPQELLKYIKYSGVGNRVKANVSNLKKFLKDFSISYLEFEIVVFIKSGL